MTAPVNPPRIGALPSGPLDAITDVAGVTVGHCTLDSDGLQTGVTVIRPHAGDPWRDRPPAASVVINGFGWSVGLMQLDEVGVLETPIALTNTFSVAAVAAAQIGACIEANPECGRSLPTVHPLVLECNDGWLNDIQRMAVTASHYRVALDAAGEAFAQGSIGAGRGMSSFGLKGGIGSASRRVRVAAGQHTVGALVLANFGRLPQLVLAGRPIGAQLAGRLARPAGEREKGSIIMVLATDAPLDARQLRRLALRAGAGLARTGSVFGHGSGDVVVAFSTAYTLPLQTERPMPAVAMLHDGLIDPLFQAVADAVEQSIVHALWHARAVPGRDGHRREALGDLLARWPDLLDSNANAEPRP